MLVCSRLINPTPRVVSRGVIGPTLDAASNHYRHIFAPALGKQGNSFSRGARSRYAAHRERNTRLTCTMIGRKMRGRWDASRRGLESREKRKKERKKKEGEFVLKLFSSLRHRFPLSRSPSVLLFQPVRRTAGSRHFPTKSSREDFLLIDVETAEEKREQEREERERSWKNIKGRRTVRG